MNSEKIDIVENPTKLTKLVDINGNQMITLLSALAMELDKDHASTSMSCHNFCENDELYEKLNLCQSDLRVERKRIKKLKENLRKAYIVAKTIMSTRENETMSFHDGVNNARSECADLYMKNKLNTEMVERLKSENTALLENIKHLHNFIRLGFEELQKMRNEPVNNAPTVIQLKQIILCCGQYYADYCNEKEARLQNEYKNRFLTNKISLLNTNIDALVEELKNVQYQNSKLCKENNLLKNKLVKVIERNTPSMDVLDNHSPKDNIAVSTLKNGNEDNSFDLSSHLSLVKNLLSDQDIMLEDLKKLSEVLNVFSTAD